MEKGVYQVRNGNWVAMVWSGGKLRNAGTYQTKEEAVLARRTAKDLVKSGDIELRSFIKPAKPYREVPDRLTSIVLGSLLGDGSINKMSSVTHNSFFSKKQALFREEYLKWHVAEFGAFAAGLCYGTGRSPSYPERATKNCRFYSRSDPYFTRLREIWYKDGVKGVPVGIKLNALALAVWFADDGVHSGNSVYFCSDGFSDCDREVLVANLREMGLPSYQRSGKIYLSGNNCHTIFLNLIRPYFTWDCFGYKLTGVGFKETKRRLMELYE